MGTTRSQKKGQKWGRVSRSVTKAQTALIQAERNRMIPRFSFMRPGGWRPFVTDLDTTEPIPLKSPAQRTYQAAPISTPRSR